jgi:hypothetical protein
MRTWLIPILAGAAALTTHAQETTMDNLVANGDFSQGMSGWVYYPGDATMTEVAPVEGSDGNALALHPDGKTLGVNSDPLLIGSDLDRDKRYRVQARIKSDGISEGIFAFSICCYDADGKRIQQMSVHNLSTSSQPHDWLLKKTDMGAGTAKPFPPETQSVRLRFSFYEKDGNCRGKIWVDDVRVTENSLGKFASWPAAIEVKCGPLQTRFESRSFWTLYRLEYNGKPLAVDRFGSHYGTVANFQGIGFVGSGHTENQDEKLEKLALTIDGRAVEKPETEYTCEHATLTKESRVRDIELKTRIDVYPDRIVEDVVMRTEKPEPLNLLYHFMHPWVTDMSDYLAETETGETISGEFVGDKGMKIQKPVRWSAVYSRTLEAGAVTVVVDTPDGIDWDARYWDVPDRYRKHYFTTFVKQALPAGQDLHYRVIVLPYEADPADWQQTVRERVAEVSGKTD